MKKETMSPNEALLKSWTKKAQRNNLTPVCLVCVDVNGHPHVFSDHEHETLKKVYKHLLSSEVLEVKRNKL